MLFAVRVPKNEHPATELFINLKNCEIKPWSQWCAESEGDEVVIKSPNIYLTALVKNGGLKKFTQKIDQEFPYAESIPFAQHCVKTKTLADIISYLQIDDFGGRKDQMPEREEWNLAGEDFDYALKAAFEHIGLKMLAEYIVKNNIDKIKFNHDFLPDNYIANDLIKLFFAAKCRKYYNNNGFDFDTLFSDFVKNVLKQNPGYHRILLAN